MKRGADHLYSGCARCGRDGFAPLDYSVHADRCTFYNAKLPNIGPKEDPAGYMQTENMGFAHCRFVECEVPETFLAATTDCVFEHCRFTGKGQVKWPKETKAIKVEAFYVGLDGQISSFIDGPLSVHSQRHPTWRRTGQASCTRRAVAG